MHTMNVNLATNLLKVIKLLEGSLWCALWLQEGQALSVRT